MVEARDMEDGPLEEYTDLPSENDPKGTRCYYYSVSDLLFFCFLKKNKINSGGA